jgi:O-antigen ligase
VALALVLVSGLVQVLRPGAAPGSESFRSSSTSQRVLVGAAGIQLFLNDPVLGVGWRQSNSPEVIGAPEISSELRRRFPGARADYFPDVTPASPHNTYLQVLADTGIIGLALFAAMLFGVARGVKRLMARLDESDPLRAVAWALAMSVLLMFVWLNDNPLYGGQFSTVLIAAAVGCLVAISRMRPAGGSPDAG